MLSWPADLGYCRSPVDRAILDDIWQGNLTDASTWRPGKSRPVRKAHVPRLTIPQGRPTVMPGQEWRPRIALGLCESRM
jgi:hypothetical protein